MGRNHVRILSTLAGAELVAVLDRDPEVQSAVAEEFGAPQGSDLVALIESCEAVVLAVPTVSHADLGCRILEAGLHLLVEKPIAATLDEADRLLAAAGDRVLAVGHVEYHNPAVSRLLEAIEKPGFVEIQRLASFSPRSLDVDVILDLMIHDLQILHALDPSPVAEVRAAGINVLSERDDIVNARVQLESGCVANLTASRVSAQRTRKLRVFLPQRYYSLDYQEQTVKGLRLELGGEFPAIVPDSPAIERQEPLLRELAAFVAACRSQPADLVDGAAGRRALATALAIQQAIPRPSPSV
jgi:predicted dehydrogenase